MEGLRLIQQENTSPKLRRWEWKTRGDRRALTPRVVPPGAVSPPSASALGCILNCLGGTAGLPFAPWLLGPLSLCVTCSMVGPWGRLCPSHVTDGHPGFLPQDTDGSVVSAMAPFGENHSGDTVQALECLRQQRGKTGHSGGQQDFGRPEGNGPSYSPPKL